MPSPFPGMNPYLEQAGLWRDFHNAFLVTLRAAITPRVVPRYQVEYEESLYIDPTGDEPRMFAIADTAVADAHDEVRADEKKNGVAVAAAPVTVTVPRVAKKKARRLVIRDSSNLEVVTVIEVLSPSNKEAGPDRDKYVEKRMEVLASQANFIELDLLRGGKRLPIRALPDCDYYLLVSRWWERPNIGLWPLKLRDPLPPLHLPLRHGEAEPQIDLKPVLDRTYDDAGYEHRIYRTTPEPPLSPADSEWATRFIPISASATS